MEETIDEKIARLADERIVRMIIEKGGYNFHRPVAEQRAERINKRGGFQVKANGDHFLIAKTLNQPT